MIGRQGHVLVTGATGKSGSQLIRVLREEGVCFVAGVRRVDPGYGVPQVRFDWDEPSSWEVALSGARAVYVVKPERGPGPLISLLLAAAPEVARIVLMSEMGRGASRRRIPSARPSSSCSSWRRPGRCCARAGSSRTFRQRAVTVSRSGGAAAWGSPAERGGRFSLVDTRDVARAALVALTTDRYAGAAVTLTGGRALSMAEVAAAISGATGRHVVHASGTLADYLSALHASGVDPRRLAYLEDLFTDAQAGRSPR